MEKDVKKKLLRRLKIIEGQIKGLQQMVDDEKYCIDVINQAQAIKRAISSVEDLMLENHLSTHVIEQMKNGDTAKAIEEIISVYKIAKKKHNK